MESSGLRRATSDRPMEWAWGAAVNVEQKSAKFVKGATVD
jgi:hypothetical protein